MLKRASVTYERGNKVRIDGAREEVVTEMEKLFRFGWVLTPGSAVVDNRRLTVEMYQPPDYKERIEARKSICYYNEEGIRTRVY